MLVSETFGYLSSSLLAMPCYTVERFAVERTHAYLEDLRVRHNYLTRGGALVQYERPSSQLQHEDKIVVGWHVTINDFAPVYMKKFLHRPVSMPANMPNTLFL